MRKREMIKYKENFLNKIKRIIKSKLNKNKTQDSDIEHTDINAINFRDKLKKYNDNEDQMIRKLQKEYKKKQIREEDINKEDMKKLIKLYEIQNEELSQNLEKEKMKFQKMLEKYKSSSRNKY